MGGIETKQNVIIPRTNKKKLSPRKAVKFFFPLPVYPVKLFPERHAYQIVNYGFIIYMEEGEVGK